MLQLKLSETFAEITNLESLEIKLMVKLQLIVADFSILNITHCIASHS